MERSPKQVNIYLENAKKSNSNEQKKKPEPKKSKFQVQKFLFSEQSLDDPQQESRSPRSYASQKYIQKNDNQPKILINNTNNTSNPSILTLNQFSTETSADVSPRGSYYKSQQQQKNMDNSSCLKVVKCKHLEKVQLIRKQDKIIENQASPPKNPVSLQKNSKKNQEKENETEKTKNKVYKIEDLLNLEKQLKMKKIEQLKQQQLKQNEVKVQTCRERSPKEVIDENQYYRDFKKNNPGYVNSYAQKSKLQKQMKIKASSLSPKRQENLNHTNVYNYGMFEQNEFITQSLVQLQERQNKIQEKGNFQDLFFSQLVQNQSNNKTHSTDKKVQFKDNQQKLINLLTQKDKIQVQKQMQDQEHINMQKRMQQNLKTLNLLMQHNSKNINQQRENNFLEHSKKSQNIVNDINNLVFSKFQKEYDQKKQEKQDEVEKIMQNIQDNLIQMKFEENNQDMNYLTPRYAVKVPSKFSTQHASVSPRIMERKQDVNKEYYNDLVKGFKKVENSIDKFKVNKIKKIHKQVKK